MNLVSASNAQDKKVLWGFVTRYAPESTAESDPEMDHLLSYALNYFQDFILPHKKYRAPDSQEILALEDLKTFLTELEAHPQAEDIQSGIYQIGKKYNYENLRDWFKALYEILLGQEQGPRLGSFIQLYGIEETIALIESALKKTS